MTDFKVNTSRLNADAESVHGYVGRINKEMTELQKAVAKLDSMWDGPASEAFHRVFLDDLTALSTMIANLNKMYDYQVTAKGKYETCENRVIGEVNRI